MASKNHIFYERFLEQVKLTRKTINGIEKELGYPRNALNNYKNGIMPSAVRIVELSHYFGVTPEYLLGSGAGQREVSIEAMFNSLSDDQKLSIHIMCQKWAASKLF